MTEKPAADNAAQPGWFFRFFAAYTAVVMVMLAVLYVDFFRHPLAPDPNWDSVAYRLFVALLLVPGGLIIGALVLRRAPGNVTGLFLLLFAEFMMRQGTVRVGSPLQPYSSLLDAGAIGLFLLPLYFPDGLAYPRRFQRWIRLHSVLVAIFFVVSVFFQPATEIAGGAGQVAFVPNPLFHPALQLLVEPVSYVQSALFVSVVLMIIPSLVLRFSASSGVVRQQIKWFVWIITVLMGTFILLLFIFPRASFDPEEYGSLSGLVYLWRILFFPAAPFVAVAIPILRYRLYDIDIIIRKTLVYSILTAILAALYFGGVVLVQQLFRAATGQASDLAIVLSTLLIAALFTPLRRRIQETIDRRFYRRKYDAQQTLAHFSHTLRDEVDIEALKAQLVDVVQETMQPAMIALWVPLLSTGDTNTVGDQERG